MPEALPGIGPDDIAAARSRIAGLVRHTPVIAMAPTRTDRAATAHALLKVESLQVTGSFKARGAVNKLKTLGPETLRRGVVTASGGNHGLAVAYAGWIADVPATIFLPETAPAAKIAKLQQWGAKTIVTGARWDDANEAALAHAQAEGMAYIHPFADPAVVAGQATLGDEIADDLPDVDTVLVAIGGGGLCAGVSAALKLRKPSIRVIGVEPTGAPTLYETLKAGRIIVLPKIETAAGTLAAGYTEPYNFEIIRRCVERVVLVTDDEMRHAARWLWFELSIGAELSGAATTAALLAGRYVPEKDERVCAIICGSGTDGIG